MGIRAKSMSLSAKAAAKVSHKTPVRAAKAPHRQSTDVSNVSRSSPVRHKVEGGPKTAVEAKTMGAPEEGEVHHTSAKHPAASLDDGRKDPILRSESKDPLTAELESQAAGAESVTVDRPHEEQEVVRAILNSLTGIKNNLPANGELNRQQIDMLDKALGDLIRNYGAPGAARKITRNA